VKRADEIEPASPDQAVALSYFTLLMKRDMEGFADIWHDDAAQDIPFPPEGFGKFVTARFADKGEIMDHYNVAFANRRDHVFWIDEIYETKDPGTVIIEAHARSVVGETEKVYENNYICVFVVRDGKLALLKEYANPLAFMNAFGGGFDAHR
jgi:uncharacterized protein